MSSLVRQKFLTHKALIQLKGEVTRTLADYAREEPWLSDHFASDAYEMPSAVFRPETLALQMPDRAGRDLKDYENACVVHGAFKDLNPAQASDPRLWTHLTHVDCWSYMRRRWPVPAEEKRAPIQRINFVRSHYFLESSASRSLTRNGIAGLWWFAHLTYDPARTENPYALTRILLQKLDVTKNFIERNLGRNQNILRGFLELLDEEPEILNQLGGGERGRAAVRALTRRLNAYGGVSLLDQLEKPEIKDVIRRCLEVVAADGSIDAESGADEDDESAPAPADA